MQLNASIIIIAVTVIVSLIGFGNREVIDKLIFYPPAVSEKNQWYRFFSCGLIHADTAHLLFNMLALFLFGYGQADRFGQIHGVESRFTEIFGDKGIYLYTLMYVLALAVCLLPTYKKNRHNYNYRSLGASGAVSAVVFISILFNPTSKIGFYFLPPIIPAFIFGPAYLIVSGILEKKQVGNVNHSAHIWGALFGMAFIIATAAAFSDYKVIDEFIFQVKGYFN